MLRHSWYRFLASGVLNTLASYALYLLLLQFMAYAWAYSMAYVLGVTLAYGLQRYYVFRRTGGILGPLWVILIYLVQYLLGLGLVALWVQGWGQPKEFAPAFAVAISFPLSYLASRWVFR